MDRLEQMEELVVMAKKLVDHNMGVAVDLHEHSIVGRSLACEFMIKSVEYQINFHQLIESHNYRKQRGLVL